MNTHRSGAPVIIGGGIAGLLVALHLAPQPVTVLTRAPLGEQTSSGWAQGGVAAAMAEDDSPALHTADTLAAGNGLCDPDMTARILAEGPAAIRTLAHFGAQFDAGLGREAAHGRRRIVHAHGDGTGREIMRALVAAVRATPSITVLDGVDARRLLLTDGVVSGVLAARNDTALTLRTARVVIATGGVGGLFQHTTNPPGSFGQGLSLAARAGAVLSDIEFVQFHPTALALDTLPLPLISEAVRGEGAILVDECHDRFMADVPGAELAPRDVVARTIWAHLSDGHQVFLDARTLFGGVERFPGIAAICANAGIDPASQRIPVRPAAHYHMGGIAVDAAGRSSVPGLWACGEAARTGLHGANRLASNSLLEGAVCARWVAEDLADERVVRATPEAALPPAPEPATVRPIVSRALGVLRDRAGLTDAIAGLLPLADHSDPAALALMMAVAALHRVESRGAHARTDHPQTEPGWAHSTSWTLAEVVAAARALPAHKAAYESASR